MHSLQFENHLKWRAGFGPTGGEWNVTKGFSPQKAFAAMVKASANIPAPIEVFPGGAQAIRDAAAAVMTGDNAEKRKMVQAENRKAIRRLNVAWLHQMVTSPAALREKVSFFWHGHFACRTQNSLFQQQLLHIIRRNALGNFKTLLHEVSKSPAMLQFLNNQQNRKSSPNENFAREVMELFTLGRGNYSETDVKEAARAFTGWGFDAEGNFTFRQAQHDYGRKTVLGKTAHFTGEALLDWLLEQPAAATWICTKMYRFFVNDTPHAERIARLAERFRQSGYEILPLLTDFFTSDWFYHASNMGNRIKSPVELWVGLRRMLHLHPQNEEMQLLVQRALGQVLFFPPNVAGWPGGKAWIDSSTLLLRMRLPQLLSGESALDIQLKDDDDNEMGLEQRVNRNRFRTGSLIDWNRMLAGLPAAGKNAPWTILAAGLLQTHPLPEPAFLASLAGPNENTTARMAATIMSLPEYQLC